MTTNRVRTWAETVKEAEALEEVAALIERYLPPDSGIKAKDVVSEIIGILETKAGHVFDEPLPEAAHHQAAE